MYLLFDIGGTKTRMAYSEDGESFGEPVKFETLPDFDAAMTKIKEEAETLLQGRPVEAIAGGAGGPMNREQTKMARFTNIPTWNNHPFEETLSEMFGNVPVHFNNDAAIVALGETHYGAARGYDIVAYLTISTGVGGARVVDGMIDRSAIGYEPGWHIIDFDQTACEVCHSGNAEHMVSGTATAVRYGKKAYEVHEPEAWEELAKWLAVVVNNTICFWSPDVVVLGGSMIVGDPAIPVDRTAEHVKEMLNVYPEISDIKQATLGDFGGLHGALAYAKQMKQA